MESDFWIIPVPLEVKHIAYKYNSGLHIDGSIQVKRRHCAQYGHCMLHNLAHLGTTVVVRGATAHLRTLSGYQIWVWNRSGYETGLGTNSLLY